MKKIQMVDLHSQYLTMKDEIDGAIQQVIDESSFIKGSAVKEFANSFAKYNNVKKVVTCGNGTDALQIALMALDLKKGDEVIIPAHTYVATVEVIALLGLTPVLVDVDPNTFNIDIEQVEDKITNATKAIVPVHLYGQCADMESLLKIAKEHDLKIIEDTAQALGATYTFSDGKKSKAGTMGYIGTTSFFPTKNLGCFGDGGALLVNDETLGGKINMIANHGQRVKYHHDLIGCNSRLDTIHAAVLNVKLAYLDEAIEKRQKAASVYTNGLKEVEGIQIPQNTSFSTHSYHQYTLKINKGERDVVKSELLKKGIPSMIYYPVPIHLQKAYQQYGYKKGDFTIAERLPEIVLSLPIHPEISVDQQLYIMDSLTEIMKKI